MTGVVNMFGLDIIMIRVGGWDILVEWASIVIFIIIGGIKIPKALKFIRINFKALGILIPPIIITMTILAQMYIIYHH